jgi:hypothetical protein
MAVEVTENWSARRLHYDWDVTKWTATRTLCVAYAASEQDALNAAAAGAPGVYPLAIGTEHPLSGFLSCLNTSADRNEGLNITLVTGEYGFPNVTLGLDPLHQPPIISWQPSLTSAELEYDPNGSPIVTAAGQPFDPPSMTDIGTRTLIVERFVPFYDADYAGTIENTLNSDAFQIKGVAFNTSLRPGTVRLKSYAPVGTFTNISPFPKVRWCMEVRGSYATDVNQFSDAWDVRRVNKGTIGWRARISTDPAGNGPVTDYFYRPSGVPDTTIGPVKLTEAAYLDLEGKPLDPVIRVGYGLNAAVPNPTPITNNPLLRYEKKTALGVPGGFIYILHYRRFRDIPFTGLIPGV